MLTPDLTEAERESLGRVLTTADTLVTVVPGGSLATAVERIVADRLAAERERIAQTILGMPTCREDADVVPTMDAARIARGE